MSNSNDIYLDNLYKTLDILNLAVTYRDNVPLDVYLKVSEAKEITEKRIKERECFLASHE